MKTTEENIVTMLNDEYDTSCFSKNKMFLLRMLNDIGVSPDTIKLCADPRVSMNDTLGIARLYINPLFTEEQKSEIFKGLYEGLPVDLVDLYADARFSVACMIAIRVFLEEHVHSKNVSSYSQSVLEYLLNNPELTQEEIEVQLPKLLNEIEMRDQHKPDTPEPSHHNECNNLIDDYKDTRAGIIHRHKRTTCGNEKIDDANYSNHSEILDAGSLTDEQIQFCLSQEFTRTQITQILQGFRDKLSISMIKTYADSRLKATQMRAIRVAIRNGLPVEFAKELADPNISYEETINLRNHFQENMKLSREESYNK